MIERRHFPRYSCELQLGICSPENGIYSVQANDISNAGISLMVSQSVLSRLSAEGLSLETGTRFQLTRVLNNTDPEAAQTRFACQVMHVRRLSQEHYLIGAWFNDMEDTERHALQTLIDNARNTIDE
jgi:c-di-GMP-binding flagellar brake protein YcgR